MKLIPDVLPSMTPLEKLLTFSLPPPAIAAPSFEETEPRMRIHSSSSIAPITIADALLRTDPTMYILLLSFKRIACSSWDITDPYTSTILLLPLLAMEVLEVSNSPLASTFA
jgi:hypothetical protein